MTEKVPTDEKINVIETIDIFKTKKWWKAVVLGETTFEGRTRKSVSVYLWQWEDGKWKRIHKLKENSREDWEKTKAAMDKLVAKLAKVL